jgi:hypothetical protein
MPTGAAGISSPIFHVSVRFSTEVHNVLSFTLYGGSRGSMVQFFHYNSLGSG